MTKSPDAEGAIVSHEALYGWIYALPKGELAKAGILLQSRRTKRKNREPLGERTGGRIIGMVSIDDRPEEAADRRVPGAWEGFSSWVRAVNPRWQRSWNDRAAS